MQMVTANRLVDGVVVYLRGAGDWCEDLKDARIADGKDAGENLLTLAKADVVHRLVVDPYLIDVMAEAGTWVPARIRERIRSLGPTVRTDLGKQAAKG
jgi:sulfite reductase (NADPH) hemoprotein beta-component